MSRLSIIIVAADIVAADIVAADIEFVVNFHFAFYINNLQKKK